jgi:acetyl-CoA synthetase
MLPRAATYKEIRDRFRWDIPARYNIAIDACDRWAAVEPDRIAIIHQESDGTVRRLSYGALADASNRLANVFTAHGVQRGDRVAILLPQSPEAAITHIAAYKCGAIALPLAALFGIEALAYRLANSGAKAIVTNRAGLMKLDEVRDKIASVRLILSTTGAEAGAVDFAATLARGAPTFTVVDTSPDDPAMMIYTSGTTGAPKGALHAHRVLLGHLPGVQLTHEFLPREGDLMWTPADWAWAGGLLNILLPALRFGVPVLSCRFEKFDPEFAYRLMADHGVKNTFVPPTALKMLRTVPRPRERFGLALRTIGSGGEALGSETYEWAKDELKLTINEFYGQTECNLVLGSCAAIGVTRAGAIGLPVPGHHVAVISDDGHEVERGTLGQIAIARPDPVMFLEYWGRPDATREKFIGDWMTTGDQGVMDADGYVHFVGRDDDVITSAGYRIGPAEIEDCLVGHRAVELAAVIGKPDPLRTEIVKAFVRLKPGFTPDQALADEIRTFVRTRLSAHEYPREIAFVDDIPLTTTGKVIRRLFREQARAEAATEQAKRHWE